MNDLPGSTGLPLLGQTLPFLADEFAFVREGVRRHGPVFRSHVLGRDTAIIAGPEATIAFNNDELVQRAGGMPGFVEAFLGGRSLPLMDGEAHRRRKRLVMAAFTREAMAGYLPEMQRLTEEFFAAHAGRTELMTPALKRLTLSVIARTMFSADPGPDLDEVLASFDVLARSFSAVPIKIPGTQYMRGIAARDRILAIGRRLIEEHRRTPVSDGLGRLLAATDGDARLSDDEALLELHHFNIAGFATFTHLAMMLVQLAQREDVRGRLVEEVARECPSGPIEPRAIAKMSYLGTFVQEIKRYTPFIPVFFGIARKDFQVGGRTIPAGWMVLWGHHASCYDPAAFPDPDRFDPDRFGPERAEDLKTPGAYAPQGLGEPKQSHRCAGYDYSTTFLAIFATILARGVRWSLPEQDLTLRHSMVPPEFADGLKVSFA